MSRFIPSFTISSKKQGISPHKRGFFDLPSPNSSAAGPLTFAAQA
jgi:hypothetical protein